MDLSEGEVDVDTWEISDEELTALALAADPDSAVDLDAVPWASDDQTFPELLPAWYMPVPAVGAGSSRRHKVVVSLIIGSLLVVNALGLCVTSGFLEIA